MSFLAWSLTPKPQAAVSLMVTRCLPASAEWLFINFLGPFSISKGNVSGVSDRFRFGSSRRATRLVAGGNSLSMQLGAKFGLLEQLRVLVYLAACTERVVSCRLGIGASCSPKMIFLYIFMEIKITRLDTRFPRQNTLILNVSVLILNWSLC